MTNSSRASRNHATESETDPGDFSFASSVPYADKSEYIEKSLAFSIVAIDHEPGRGFDGADRWAVTVEPEDSRGREIITLSCNDKRDTELKKGREYVGLRGPIRNVRLKQSGKAFYFHSAADGQRAT